VVAVGVVVVKVVVAGVAAVAGNDFAAQSAGTVDDSHEMVDNGLSWTYRGVLEVENGECATRFPPHSSFGLYTHDQRPRQVDKLGLGTRVCTYQLRRVLVQAVRMVGGSSSDFE
jgi:hypothetical protein